MAQPFKFKQEFVEQARKLCQLGATNAEVADFFEVELRTIYRWQNEYSDFASALRIGKEPADDRVERSLYDLAIAGDVVSCIFWLKNRRGWRDKRDLEHSGGVTIMASPLDEQL